MKNFQKTITTYGVYFEELRQKILLLTKIFVVVFGFGFFATTPAIKLMMKYIDMPGVTIVTTSPFQLLDLAMSIGFFTACVVVVPVFVYHLYTFLKPGLLPKERASFLLSLPIALGLFLTGFLYGCAILYFGIKLIAQVNVGLGIGNFWNISTFISQIVVTSSLLGLLFIFPLIISFLVKLGIMSISMLKSRRKHAVVIIFMIVSLFPPTDGVSLIMMALPLVLIFELTILFNRRSAHGRQLVA